MTPFASTNHGFTLLEVLIALAIAGLAAVAVGAAVPAWTGRSRLERAAAEIDRVIERARDAALAGAVTTVRLEGRRVGSPELDLWAAVPAGITVRLVGVIGGAPTASGRAPVPTSGAGAAKAFATPAAAVSGASGDAGAERGAAGGSVSAGTIAFLPDGSSSGGLVEVSNGAATLSRRVSWLTGRIDHDPPR